MAVYVDKPIHRYGRMLMCHMLADTEQELHAMADHIGVDRRHYQCGASTPHYDICRAKRTLAIKAGAEEVSRRKLVEVIRKLRKSKVT